jgi:hypothetical protein
MLLVLESHKISNNEKCNTNPYYGQPGAKLNMLIVIVIMIIEALYVHKYISIV